MKKLLVAFLFSAASLSLTADPGLIKLNKTTIDPSAAKTASSRSLEASPTSAGQYQFIVQPKSNFSAAELKEIKEMGLVKIGLIPPNAYIFLATEAQIKALGEVFPLLYTGEYKPEYKTLFDNQKTAASSADAEKALFELATKECFGSVAEFLKENNVAEYKLIYEEPPVVEAKMPLSLVPALAAKSEVLSVGLKPAKKLMNNTSRGENLMNVDNANDSGYTGKGVMVIVSDTGLDSGDFSDIHPDFQNKTVIGVVGEENTSKTDWSDVNGHGTHVSGSAVGTGAQRNGKFAGTAREADLYFICIGDDSDYLSDVTDGDIEKAYNAGGRIINCSWGSYGSTFDGAYTYWARYYDTVSRKYPDLLWLFAAGNENCKVDIENNATLSYEAVCKNAMTVGASENYRPKQSDTYGDLFGDIDSKDPYYNDKAAYPKNKTQQGMACFSSRGPTKDGRAKPDIVAPGTWIKSTISIYDPYNDGVRDVYYDFMFGTSMATPLTSGAAACALQYLKENTDIASPSSALVKALLINGARSMGKGQFKNYTEIPEVTPNWVNGFGHVNLYESLSPQCGKLFALEGSIDKTGDQAVYYFFKESDGPVSATLCWNDYPGSSGAAVALVNDLDIVVSDEFDEYY
ncbi:MAG: S8 family serine peptidase, partial [Clostridia bacterium]|nr:S8 family serine peptidase [Clostridia bacterium]